MSYHCFKKRVKGPAGKEVNRWYYYWIDETGKQHQKVCKGCRNRSEAENFTRTLPPLGVCCTLTPSQSETA